MIGSGKVIRVGGFNLSTLCSSLLGNRQGGLTPILKTLFANGEQGFAYDPNALTTLFQDTAGTIPVTSTDQPVGLMLDKSKGLVLSPNRCVNGDFSAGLSGWVSNGNYWTVVGGRAYHALGAVLNALDQAFTATTATTTYLEFTAEVLTAANTAQVQFVPSGTTVNFTTGLQRIAVPVGTTNIQFKRVPSTSAEFYVDNVAIRSVLGNHAYQTNSSARPILRQTPILGNELVVNGDFSDGLTNVASRNVVTTEIVTGALKVTNAGTFYGYAEMALPTEVGKTYLFRGDVIASSGTGAAFHIASVANSSDIATNVEGSAAAAGFMFTAKTTTTYLSLKTPSNATGSWRIFDNISVKEITGYRTNQNYLEFDGIDDFLVTNAIDFTATDKVTVFTGIRKLSDAATAVVAELGADSITVNGTFGLFAPAGTGVTKFQFLSRGATGTNYAQALNAIYNAPISAVVRGIGSIADQKSELHVNGVLAGKSPTGLTGAGKYSANPLYIGRRGGVSLPFNGSIYGLIGVGRLTSETEVLAIEQILAKRTGVTLSV